MKTGHPSTRVVETGLYCQTTASPARILTTVSIGLTTRNALTMLTQSVASPVGRSMCPGMCTQSRQTPKSPSPWLTYSHTTMQVWPSVLLKAHSYTMLSLISSEVLSIINIFSINQHQSIQPDWDYNATVSKCYQRSELYRTPSNVLACPVN